MDEFDARLRAARATRSDLIEDDGYEVYKFCFNGREDEWIGRHIKTREPEEIFASDMAVIAEEFYGELFDTMTPEHQEWVAYEAGNLPEDFDEKAVLEFIREREKIIKRALRASNYYDEGPTAFQDAIFGTVALWSDRYHIADPITFEAVPASELDIRLGPDGLIDDRFRTKKYYYRDLPALFPNADFSKELKSRIDRSKTAMAKVVRGYWRDWSDPGNPVWRQDVRVDGKPIGMDDKMEGEGACPLTVGRFGPEPQKAWGKGPARRVLADMRVIDETARLHLVGLDHNVDPAFTYTHDGMLDLSDGIESGMGYPSMMGSEVKPIVMGDVQTSFFSIENQLERLRHAFYRDQPQRGKTPPSASQYMSEAQRQLRRIARPAGKMWLEIGVGVLRRVEYLETQAGGALPNGDFRMMEDAGAQVIMRPISPLERAQATQDVEIANGIMDMMTATQGPEATALMVDGPETFRQIKTTLNDKLVKLRTEDQIKELAQAMQGGGNGPDTSGGA